MSQQDFVNTDADGLRPLPCRHSVDVLDQSTSATFHVHHLKGIEILKHPQNDGIVR